MSTIRFMIPTRSRPQPRHSFSIGVNGRPRPYIPDSSPVHTFKESVSLFARGAMGSREPLACAIEVRLLFALPRPKSYRKSLDYEWRITKPDFDNLEKSCLDACKGIVYIDDSLITSVRTLKVTVPSGGQEALYAIFRECGAAREPVAEFLAEFAASV